MIYIPISVGKPINPSQMITIQKGLTNNFPDIVFELHQGKEYFDLGDSCTVVATITNTDLESEKFTGNLEVLNPHRGQILCQLVAKDFTMTGINTLTILFDTGLVQSSFQTTIFVQSVSESIGKLLL